MVMDFDEISIDYSFIVSALALRCKEFIKFYNWNMQRILQRLKIKWIDSSNFVTQYFILKQFTIENSIISKIKYHLIFYLTMLTTLFFDKKVTYYKIAGDTGAIIFGIICFICCCYSFFKPGGMCQGQCCGGRDPYGPSCADICCESCRG